MKLKLIILVCLIAGAVVPLKALTTAQQADSAYNKENYNLAIELYNRALDENGRNSDLYYNLGNACYLAGRISGAVLAYERALRIDPSNSDARANLDFVNARLEDKPEDNNSVLTRAHTSVVEALPANAWAWTALVVFALLCAAIATYIFSSDVAVRKAGFFSGIVLLVLAVYFAIVAAGAASRVDDHNEAIVKVPSTLLNSVPRQPRETEKVVPLHEGTKVEIIDSIATPDDPVSPRWYNVRINGSAGAWLRATDVERI